MELIIHYSESLTKVTRLEGGRVTMLVVALVVGEGSGDEFSLLVACVLGIFV